MKSLVSRLLRRHDTRKAAHLTFTVYSRAQCGCCEKAMKVLKESQRRFGFAIEEVDIDHDPDLVAKYNTEVPVVACQRQGPLSRRGQPGVARAIAGCRMREPFDRRELSTRATSVMQWRAKHGAEP